jgi:hypothetical protein
MDHKITFLDNNSFSSSKEKFLEIMEILNSRDAERMRHDELEDMLKTEGQELLSRLFQVHKNNRGMGDVGPSV